MAAYTTEPSYENTTDSSLSIGCNVIHNDPDLVRLWYLSCWINRGIVVVPELNISEDFYERHPSELQAQMVSNGNAHWSMHVLAKLQMRGPNNAQRQYDSSDGYWMPTRVKEHKSDIVCGVHIKWTKTRLAYQENRDKTKQGKPCWTMLEYRLADNGDDGSMELKVLCVVKYKKKKNFKSTNTESYPDPFGASTSMIQQVSPIFGVHAANLGDDFPNIGSYTAPFGASTSRLPATLGADFQNFGDSFGFEGVPSGILDSHNIRSYTTPLGASTSMLPATLGNDFQGFGDNFGFGGASSGTLNCANIWSNPTPDGASTSMIQQVPPNIGAFEPTMEHDLQSSSGIFGFEGAPSGTFNIPNISSNTVPFRDSTSVLPGTPGEHFHPSFGVSFGFEGVPSGIPDSHNIRSYTTPLGASTSMLPATLGNDFQGFGDNFGFEGASSGTLNSANIQSNPTPDGASTSTIHQVPPNIGAFDPIMDDDFQSSSYIFGFEGAPSSTFNIPNTNTWSNTVLFRDCTSMLPGTPGEDFHPSFGDSFWFEFAPSDTLDSANIWSNFIPFGASTSMVRSVQPNIGASVENLGEDYRSSGDLPEDIADNFLHYN